jgi:hypothetical protein
MPSAHALLGASPNASPTELRRAFRLRVFALHPDRAGGAREAELRAAIAAYEQLTGKARASRRRARSSAGARSPTYARSRYNCGGCGDTFTLAGECSRCALPLAEAERPPYPHRPDVEAFEARLSAPPSPVAQRLAAHRERLPALALGGCFLFGSAAMAVHAPIALLAVGYGLALFVSEAWAGRACG